MELADSSTFFSLREGGRGLGLKQTKWPLIAGRELLTGQIVPTEPILFGYAFGSVPGDLIMCSDTDVLLISGLFRSVLEDNQFTGWSTYPVVAATRHSGPVEGYAGLVITGRAGRPRWDLGERFTTGYVPSGPAVPSVRGLLFDADTWDGSDLFLLGDTGWKIVTRAVRDALKKARVRNVALDRCRDIDVSVRSLEKTGTL